MLTMTDQAHRIVRQIALQPGLDGAAGLRIARNTEHPDDHDRFTTGLASGPQDGDAVVVQDGARVFLAPVAARTLEDSTLDARYDDRGRIEFVTRTASAG